MALLQDETTTEQPSIDYEALGLEPVSEEELFGFGLQAEAPEAPKADTPEIDYEALGLEPVSEKELFGFEVPKKDPEGPSDWDTLRGFEVALRQVPQLAYGVAGLVGATSEQITGYGEALRDWGFRGYKEWEESMEPISKETDDVTVAWERAKQGDIGALVDWAQYGVGYALGQLGETAAVSILGGLAGAAAGAPAGGVGAAPAAAGGAIAAAATKQGFKALARDLVEKAIASQATKIVTREAERKGVKLTAEQVAKEASQDAIKRQAGKEIGSNVAVFGNAIGMQLGSIYGEAESKAQAEGRDLTGYDLARVWGTGIATGGLEGFVDKLGLDLLKGKLSGVLPEGRLAGAAVAGGVGTFGEAATEGIQTVGERFGAGKDILGDEALNEYINAAALGGLGGGVIGGAGGFVSGNPKENAAAKAKVAAEASKNIAPESSKVVADQADAVINEVAQETPDEKVARLQREAQEAAGEIELEEEPSVSGLPPERIKSARWFESAARNRLKELQDKDDAGVEDFTTQERDEFEFLKTSPTPEQIAKRYGYGVAPTVEPTAVTTTTPPTTPAVAEPAPVEPKPTLTPPPTVTEPTAPTTLQPDLLTPEGKTGEERSTIDQENRRKTEEFINGLEDGEYQVFDSSGEKNGIAKVRTNKSGKKVVEYVTDDGKQFIGDAKSLVPELNFARFTDATGKEGFDRGSIQKLTPPPTATAPVTPTPEAAVAPVEPQPIVTEETSPPAPEPTTKAAAPPQPTVAGFTTAKGSTYEVTPEGKTVRTKRSEGRGQGETYEPHSVLFVPSETNYSILSDMQGGMGDYSIRMGYSEGNRFIQVTDTNQIPADVTPQIAIVSRSTQQIIPNGVYDAQRNPEVGFNPVEKLYKPDGTSSTHLGNQITEIRPTPEAAPAAVEPTPVAPPPVTPQLEPLRRVARAEQTEEDVAGLVDAGFVELYKGQPVITEAGLISLPEAERPRLTPEARKIQIDTRTSEAAAEAISKNLRIGVDQVPVDVRMPAGWTLEGDIYVPPQAQAVAPAPTPEVRESRREDVATLRITANDARELQYKIGTLLENADLQSDYGITSEQAKQIYNSIPAQGGNWNVPAWANQAVRGELEDQARVLRDMADDARGENRTAEALQMNRQANKLKQLSESMGAVRESRREPAITPQQDRDYLDAVERGDLDAASRVVEDAAKPATHKFIDASVTQSQRIRWVASANKQINFWEAELKKIPTKSQATKEYQELVKAWNDAGLGRGPEDVIRGIMELKLQPPPANLEEYLKTRIDLQKIGVEKELEKAKEILSRTPAGQDQTQFKTGEPTVVKVYHSTPFGRLTEFSDEMLGAFTGAPSATRAHFFAGSPDVSETYYADSSWLLNHKGFFQLSPDQKKDLISSARESLPNGLESTSEEIAELAESLFDIANYNTEPVENVRHDVFVRLDNPLVYDFKGAGYREVSFNDLLIQAEQGGHDGVIMANTTDAGPAATIDSFPEPVNIVAVLRGHSNQIKLADPITRDNQGNIIPLSQRFQPEQADIRYARREQQLANSLDSGDFVSAQALVDGGVTMDRATFLRSITPSATQRATTIHTRLERDGIISKDEFANEQGLVYGDGRGAASAYLGAESYEPFPPAGFAPDYSGDRVAGQGAPIDKKFRTILNTFVLNVVDPQTRSFIVKDIANLLENGGRAVFVTRGKDVANSQALVSFGPLERIQRSEGKLTYQKGFTQSELIQYLQETLGDGFEVRALRGGSASDVRVEVVKNTDATLDNPPIVPEARERRRVQMGRAGMETSAVEARLQELGFPTGGIIRVVNEPDADFEGRTIILDGKVTGIELNAAAMRDNATIDRVLNHEFAESANADGALNRLVERLTPKEKKEINDTITRLRYEERARTSEEAARAIETLAEAWKGRGFFTRAVARVEAWASKLGFKLTRRAAEYIAARNLADINAGFRTAYNQTINRVLGDEARYSYAGMLAVTPRFMRDSLKAAQSMAAAGKTNEEIRLATGWFKGKYDNKLRWEIPDYKSFIKKDATKKLKEGGDVRLEDVLDHPELYAAYPDAKRIKVYLMTKDEGASYAANTIGINPFSKFEGFNFRNAMLHEIQHWIQDKEGFASGTSPERFAHSMSRLKEDLKEAEEGLRDIKREWYDSDEQYQKERESWAWEVDLYKKIIRAKERGLGAYQIYQLAAGEIEANDVERRNSMDEEARKRYEPYAFSNVSPEDAIAMDVRGAMPTSMEVRESRRESEAIPTFTEGTPEAATLKEMATSMAKVDAASEAKGGKPETYKISEIASVWMDSGLGERELQDAIVEYTNLTPANAAKVAKAIARQYDIQQSIATAFLETQTGLSVEALPEGVTLPKEVDPDRPKPVMQRLFEVFMGVRVPPVKITGNEKTLLKQQIRLKAAANRAAKGEQQKIADAVVDTIKEMELRGPVRPRQAQALAKRAAKVLWTSEKSVEAFTEYAAKVVENTNYDADIREAKAAQKRAKELSKQKKVAMSPQREILNQIGNVAINKLEDPRLFAETINYYLRGFKDVRSPEYVVVPDAEMVSYISQLETEAGRDQIEVERESNERLARKYDLDPDTIPELMGLINIIEEIEGRENREALEKILTDKAIETQEGLRGYDTTSLTNEQKRLVDAMNKVDLKSINTQERQMFIRIANNMIYNNQTNGAEYFVATAQGQQNAREAARDAKLVQRNKAWIPLIPSFGSLKLEETLRNFSLELQSIADTFRNVFGKDFMAKAYEKMGMLNLNEGFTKANNTIDEIQDLAAEFHQGNEKKFGAAASDQDGILSEGVAGFLIQSFPFKDEATSIEQRRNLINEYITNARNSRQKPRVAMADRVEAILNKVDGNSVQEILNNLKREYPANYEVLMWYKDVLFPKYKGFLKQFDENFNDQANNYDSPNYLPISFTSAGPALAVGPEDVSIANAISLQPKQSVYTIKRQDYTTLPKDRDGKPKEIEFNLRRTSFNSLSDQINKAYTSAAWQQLFSFMKTPESVDFFGDEANRDFFVDRLNRLRASRARRGSVSGGALEKALDSFSIISRKLGTGIALGGAYQWIKQPPDQLITAWGSGGRGDLLAKNLAPSNQKLARELLNLFSIGRRGDSSAGYKYINQMEGHQSRMERYFTERRFDKAKEQAGKIADVWMIALKKSDFIAASAAWMTYYEGELNKNEIYIDDWAKEAELIKTDPVRREAAAFAENMTDIYQGSSDPTSMATFAQSGKTGWENFTKALLVPFNSFAIQQRMRLYSDARDALLGNKSGVGGLAGTIGGLILFHATKRYVIPAASGVGIGVLYSLMGVDVEEPDEEKRKEMADRNWRQFLADMTGNLLVGGTPQIVESEVIKSFNRASYLVAMQLESESVMDENGEIMSFDKYSKERSPFYRYQSYDNAMSLGMFDIGLDQAKETALQTKMLMDRDEMDMYTPEEQRLLYFSALSEWLLLMRLNDTDFARLVKKARRDMIKAAEEREKQIKKIRSGGR